MATFDEKVKARIEEIYQRLENERVEQEAITRIIVNQFNDRDTVKDAIQKYKKAGYFDKEEIKSKLKKSVEYNVKIMYNPIYASRDDSTYTSACSKMCLDVLTRLLGEAARTPAWITLGGD